MSFDLSQRDAQGGVIYVNTPFAESHPRRLATMARLFGMQPAPVEQCRVLELGCAVGGNLLPMAELLPGTEFVGIDRSQEQIEVGQSTAELLDLKNVQLRALDILDVDESLGRFDYIVCHGVFSWTPEEVQDKILTICCQNLNSNGVAYVNFNTLPGWHLQGMLRDMIRYSAMKFDDPVQRAQQARKAMSFLGQAFSSSQKPVDDLIRGSLQRLSRQSDGVLFHAYLNVKNQPKYFHQFAEQAARTGLQYLTDADPSHLCPGGLGAGVEQALRELAPDLVAREQYLDFMRNQASRRSLLCHESVSLDRGFAPERLARLFLSANLRAEPESAGGTVTFRQPSGLCVSTADRNMKTALAVLAESWPAALSFEHVHSVVPADTANLHRDLLECYSTGIIEIDVRPNDFALDLPARPQATKLARHQAKAGANVCNLRHSMTQLSDLDRTILQLLDGRRDWPQLAETLTDQTGDVQTTLRDSLQRLARQGLLLALKEEGRSPPIGSDG